MKALIFTLLSLAFFQMTNAQSFYSLDKSPMDVAYLPDNFAHDREANQKAILKIYYSRPQKKDRDIFGKKVAFGKVWRSGANEANEMKVYQDITLGGKRLSAGTYSLFTIPGEKEWTIIVNSELDYWGAYSYQEEKDVLRVTAPVKSLSEVVESFSIRMEETGDNTAVLRIGWDQTMVEVPVTY